ncbi:META domain-containing protein [Swaminathania salitolerans]|uniref:META domain-containing protein n=1 Tax=Swaminathania salitolerans TaxID=182838 RepID=UPI0011BE73A9|nr:META domain-containing protein [Swaminathania salitolerans]
MSVKAILLSSLIAGGTVLATQARADEKTLSGMVGYSDKAPLPADALVSVSLDDVSLADAPAIPLGKTEFAPVSRQPFGYSLAYDPAKIVAGHRYALHADIHVADKLLYTSTIANVAMGRVPAGTTLTLQRVASQIPAELVGVWTITHIGKTPAAADVPAFLAFRPDGALSGTGGCNRMMGRVTSAGHRFSFGPTASTRMACSGPRMDQETAVEKAMQAVVSWKMDGDTLHFEDAHGASVLTLVARHTSQPRPAPAMPVMKMQSGRSK